MKKSTAIVQSVVAQTVAEMNDDERGVVLQWARQSLAIVENKQLSKVEKVTALRKIDTAKPVLKLLNLAVRLFKSKVWDNQSWARRLSFGGLAIGAATFGTQGAGVAAMGTAIGIPLALVTAAGATLLGVIIDEIQKERK